MPTSKSYDVTKLLNNLNVINWDHHLREKLSVYLREEGRQAQ